MPLIFKRIKTGKKTSKVYSTEKLQKKIVNTT